MPCIKCGAPLEDKNAVFCEKCYKEAMNAQKEQKEPIEKDDSPKNNKNKRSRKQRTVTIILSVVAILLILIMIPIIWVMSTLNSIQRENLSSDLGISKEEDLPFTDEVKNIALFGLDTRQNNQSGRSDAIIVLSIDRINKKIKLTSFARDSYVEIEGRKNKDKITHAWAYGKANLAVKTLNQNFDLDITDYVSVNFYQFAEIIDYIGGVMIDVSQSEMNVMNKHYVSYISDLGIPCEPIKEPGYQLLSGGQALAYARDRYSGSGDVARGGRQREVLAAMFEKAMQINPIKIPTVIEMILSECTTSMTSSEMLSIGMWTLANSPEMESFGLPTAECNAGGQMINGTSYYVYDLDIATRLLHEFIYPTVVNTESSLSNSEKENSSSEKK